MNIKPGRVCPVERAGSLDMKIRRWVQNPNKILKPYLQTGMTVVDLGCGPGFFTIDMAQLVGDTGQVIAVDLQDGMLQKLQTKLNGTKLENRITLHKCSKNKIGITDEVDFVLTFYMVHEVPDQEKFFSEIKSILKTGGQLLIVEPPFHVSQEAFEKMVRKTKEIGYIEIDRPKVFISKSVLLNKI